jgi:hypothetical protein
VGILTDRDLVRLAIAEIDLSQIPIAQVMSQPLVTLTLSPTQTVYSALTCLRHHQIRHLAVVDEQGQLLGVVTHDRLCRLLQPMYLLKLRRVAEVMTEQVIHAAPTASILSIAHQMVNHRKSCVVVVESLATDPQTLMPIGIITERDMVQFQRLGVNFARTEAQTVMSTALFCPKPTDSLWLVHQEMQRRRVRRLVVAGEQEELKGIVTQTSLLQVFDPAEMSSVIAAMQQQLERQSQNLDQTTQQLEQARGKQQQLHARLEERQQQLQAAYAELEKLMAHRTHQLNRAEEQFHLLANTVPVGLFQTDVAGDCVFVNQRWLEPAILILTKRYASSENAGIVMTSEKAKRARTVERAGFV